MSKAKKRIREQLAPPGRGKEHDAHKAAAPPRTGHFAWSARRLDHEYEGLWNWHLEAAETNILLGTLEEMARCTWTEIESSRTGGTNRHKKHHSMPVGQLCGEARNRLVHLFHNEELPESVFRFRLSGKSRLWGIRRGDVFELLWWDRDHKVCPVSK